MYIPSPEVIIQLSIAAILGATVGIEREIAGKDPGLRTFTLIALGSCMFAMASIHTAIGAPAADPGRIAAQVVTGVGFLGAGVIFRSPRRVTGLTTAALIWVTSAIGVTVGIGRQDLAVTGTILAIIANVLLRYVNALIRKFKPGLSNEEYE